MKEPPPISDLLRRTIRESGVPYLRLQEATGVTRSSIMRFVEGRQFLRLDAADRLSAYFGLRLITEAEAKTKPRHAKRKAKR